MALRHLLFAALYLVRSSLAVSVTIEEDIPYAAHECVDICLDSQGSFQNEDDIGIILECGSPYNDACYCATESASASSVSVFINNCASQRCAKGDLTRDISTMRSIYAGYCKQAGFTQPIVSEWHTDASGPDEETATSTEAEPSQTEDSAAPETVTDTTLVTETAASEDGAGGSRVTVGVTSTIWHNQDGSVMSAPPDSSDDDGGSGVNGVALGAGLGIGIPACLAILGVSFFFWLRQKRQQKDNRAQGAHRGGNDGPTPPEMQSHEPNYQSPPSFSPVERKPVPVSAAPSSPFSEGKSELTGQGVSRELSGREIHPLPDNSPSPPLAVPGQHEMLSESRPQELGAPDSQHHRYELPGQRY